MRAFLSSVAPLRDQNRRRLPLSSTKPGIQACVEGPRQPVEVANEVGFDKAEVSADLDARDDAAAGVVAKGRLLEGEELGGFGGGQQPRVWLGGAATGGVARLGCVARWQTHSPGISPRPV